MNLLAIIPILCAAYVLYNTLFTKNSMSTTSKLIWSLCAILFTTITFIIFVIKKPGKAK
jgi:hypothetical protein